ncbi:MAG: hypothetical protein F4X51_03175 [Gemmatimonadetes bacterium]|nr:hypothetical protein [Gemmatimonadota bacterium]MYB55371.1 hypothetical protein [Gemmatimonadota bacterium]
MGQWSEIKLVLRSNSGSRIPFEIVKELEQALAEWESQLVASLWPSRRILKISLKPYGLGDETYDFPI